MNDSMPIGAKFSIIGRLFKKKMDERLGKTELTAVQFRVLNYLIQMENDKNGVINQKNLEDLLHVTHPTMTEIIKKLEIKEYINCSLSSTDRRQKCIRSTEKANDLIMRHTTADEEVSMKILNGLSDKQIYQLNELMDVILKNISECNEKEC